MKEAQANTVHLKDYRPPAFLIDAADLKVKLFEDHAIVSSRLIMRRNPAAADAAGPLVLDGNELELLEVAVDGTRLSADQYERDDECLTVHRVPDSFVLSCKTRIQPHLNTTLEGLYKSRGMFCTQCEAEGFRRITYYLDRPDVLAVFTTTVEAEQTRYPVLLSNGNDVERGICEHDSARHWITWHDPFPKPSYLFALVAGDLESVNDTFTTCSGREISLRMFVEEKDLDKCDFALDSLKKAMRWDELTYGREYDLDVFMIVAVDDFNMGAMENKGLNIFNTACVLANPATTTDAVFQRIQGIVAHEYFHNWSGNRVTCRDWFQLSLKEGFTVFRDSQFSADMGSPTVKRVEDVKFLRTHQFAEDAGPMAHPVRPESYMEISNFYTLTVYEKGAEVVRMLAELLGRETFRRGTDLYFERFDGMAVTTEDFVRVMEEVSGLDLKQFRRWYTQAGTPELHVEEDWDPAGERYRLTVAQSCPSTPGQPRKENFYVPLAMGLLDPSGKEVPLKLAGEQRPAGNHRVLAVSGTRQTFEFVHVKERPVPSLLRGFSAPVKLHMDYSRDALRFLISHDSDGFVRWEAAQQLGLGVLNDMLSLYRKREEPAVDRSLVDACRALLEASLEEADTDKAMVAHLIQPPSEAYMAELAEGEIDVDGIHHVREGLRTALAGELRTLLEDVYRRNSTTRAYVFNADEVARRALKNTALDYLMRLDDPDWSSGCDRQFREADNMTDTSAALRILVNSPAESCRVLRDRALEDFYRQWRHESLVVQQWLAMQAGANIPDNLERVEALTEHEAFDITNPNKVRAVIGSFCNSNLVGFHDESGSGYRFLADHVLALDRLNPQIAARLLSPLTRWRRHNATRRALMQEELRRILNTRELSRDVYEVVSKSLNPDPA